ncbi:hypothetical protein ACHAXA_000457 [Cyclostephanos tholiformis]|uniref:C3H1-type domain-containing protein n=1 Tax=Cyclostephanos tholiformis TaxID=382380 RepID=A0ABD3RVX8_9STRA
MTGSHDVPHQRQATGPTLPAAIDIASPTMSAFSSARRAVVPLGYGVAAVAPLVLRSSPTSVVNDAFCAPCERDRPIAATKSFSDAVVGDGGSDGHPTPQNLRDNPERLAKVKTEMCHYFEEGGARACPFGANCNYAHGKEELKFRYTTLRLMESSGQIVNAKTYLARPCITWVSTGACPFGRRCGAIHDPSIAGPMECPSWLPAATANTNAQVIIDRLAAHRESSVHQENFLIPQSIWENCRPSMSRELGRTSSPSDDGIRSILDAEREWFDTYALVTNERVTIYNKENRHAMNPPIKKLSHLQKLCIVRLMRSDKEGTNPSSQLHRDYVFAPTHSLHSELSMILQVRYFVLLDVNFMHADEISPNEVVKEISYDEFKARITPCCITGMLRCDPNKLVTAHEVAFAPKGEHFANVSIWFDSHPVRLEQSQIKRSRRLKQKNKAQIRNGHTHPNANGALISRTSSADFPATTNNPPPGIDPFVPMLPADDDDESNHKLIMAIIEHRIDCLIVQSCSSVQHKQIRELCAREAQLAKIFEGKIKFHKMWTWPKREGMGCITMFTKAPPGNMMPYIPMKESQNSPCVHNWTTFVKTISASDANDEYQSVADSTKRLSVFRSIDGSIPRTSLGVMASLPHILPSSPTEARSTKNDGTWKEILLGLPENGRWETALRLHVKMRSGSFDHNTTKSVPLSTIPFVQS